jgi:hypothetical protein
MAPPPRAAALFSTPRLQAPDDRAPRAPAAAFHHGALAALCAMEPTRLPGIRWYSNRDARSGKVANSGHPCVFSATGAIKVQDIGHMKEFHWCEIGVICDKQYRNATVEMGGGPFLSRRPMRDLYGT